MTKKTEIIDALIHLKGEMPIARLNLSEAEKDLLIQKIGPRTARNILAMRGKTQEARIPFLFSSIDTQAVVDLLANDCLSSIEKLLAQKKKIR